MKIFMRSFRYEDKDKIDRASTGRRLELRAVSMNQSGVTTSPWDGVTFNHINSKYFKYLN
jgi:hypothetical protein